MSGILPSAGKLSVGSTAGASSSINVLKSLKAGNAANASNSSLNVLRNWFKTNVGTQGKVAGTLQNPSNSVVKMDDWHGVLIYGMSIRVRNEKKNGSYWNGTTGGVQMSGVYGARSNYRFIFNGSSKTVNSGVTASYGPIDVGSGPTSKTYAASMEHKTDTSTKESFSIKLFATTSSPIPQVIGFGLDNKTIDLGANNGGSYTTARQLLIGRQTLA